MSKNKSESEQITIRESSRSGNEQTRIWTYYHSL
jgi:hypothetical protein